MFYGFYGNSSYLLGYILVGIGVVIMAMAQAKVSSAYSRYSKIYNSRGMTGREVAAEILYQNGLGHVEIHEVRGHLSDHYNPGNRTLNLSSEVYHGKSVAALAVAAHECGHALQHKEGYKPLMVRNAIVPVCNFSQYIGWIAIVAGLILSRPALAWFGVILMGAMLAFQLITLPVEFDASSRALSILNDRYLANDEYSGAKSMLNAAALTYVASVFATLLSLLRIVLIVSSSNNRD